jgi:multiple sugar transport system substrate-binding protein
MNALFGGVILYYNKSRYQELQLKDPYERYLEGTWTWAQYLADAKVLTKFENGRPMRFGTEAPPQPMNFPVLWAFECEPFDEKRGRASVNSEGCKAGYGFIADLIWKHHVAPTASQGANAAFTFESGKLGLKYDWMGMTPRYRELIKDFEWDIVPLPKGNREHQSCVKGNQLVIAKNSKNPKLAWRFIRFMTGVETESRLYGVIRRSFPSRKSVAFSDTFLKTDQPPFNTKALTDTVANGRYLPITDRWNEWTQILSAEADNLLAGREKDPKIMIERAQEKINKVLSEEPGF